MDAVHTPGQGGIVACDVCFKEIPVSEVIHDEVGDYVHYYCGLECFAKWRAQVAPQTPADKPAGVG